MWEALQGIKIEVKHDPFPLGVYNINNWGDGATHT